jgi:glycosyltransferase involved in cell wall biosynthesis
MKIAYFHQGLWPSPSPSSTFVTFNALGFVRKGYDFTLITTRHTRESRRTVLKREFGIEEDVPMHLVGAGIFKRMHRMVYIMAMLYLWKNRCDVLITRNLGFLPYAFVTRKILGTKIVFESHDFYTDAGLQKAVHGKIKKKQMGQELRHIPRVDAILCVSEPLRQYYSKYYPGQRLLTAVTGAKTNRDYTVRSRFSHTVGFIGTFNPRIYDLEFLIRVFSKVRNEQARLVLVGAKSPLEQERIQALVSRHQMDGRIRILSWQSPKALEAIKSEMDIGCSPLVPNVRSQLCSPLKVLEYLSAGIPVIATRLEGIQEILRHGVNGFVLENDVDAWASSIDSLYSDSRRYGLFSEACLATARELSWERRAEKIHDFLIDAFDG